MSDDLAPFFMSTRDDLRITGVHVCTRIKTLSSPGGKEYWIVNIAPPLAAIDVSPRGVLMTARFSAQMRLPADGAPLPVHLFDSSASEAAACSGVAMAQTENIVSWVELYSRRSDAEAFGTRVYYERE